MQFEIGDEVVVIAEMPFHYIDKLPVNSVHIIRRFSRDCDGSEGWIELENVFQSQNENEYQHFELKYFKLTGNKKYYELIERKCLP